MKLSEDIKKWRADRPDEYTMDRFIKKAEALESMLLEFLQVPRNYDQATIPKDGMDLKNEKHRKQAICNLSVSHDRLYRAENLLSNQ